MKNNRFEEIAEVIKQKQSFLIYPHINMDGDALGSAVALCKVLRNMGKACHILIEDNIPGNLVFLDKGYTTHDQDILAQADVSICLDCGEPGRFPKRREKFDAAEVSICIDHHATSAYYCDYNYIDSKSAATGELVYDLIMALEADIDKEIGEALFAAITTDTGNFQYSNTSKKSHEIMAALYDAGIDANGVSIDLYENRRVQKILIKSKVLSTLSLLCDGKAAICCMTMGMLEETGAAEDETDGIVQEMRSIAGVEVAAFLKETSDGKVKASLRSKHYADVAEIAASLGGGGHIRAAGCTLDCSITEAYDLMKEKIVDSLGQ